MNRLRSVEIVVGFFMLIGGVALLFLAFKVSGLTSLVNRPAYHISAHFSNVGDLKTRAPVTIAGVRVGEVTGIRLQPDTFIAQVDMRIDAEQNKIPIQDTSARILTEGLLGSNYVSIVPGFDDEEDDSDDQYLQGGSRIELTQPALILENLIGQLLFNINK